jgi:phospholipase D1/2
MTRLSKKTQRLESPYILSIRSIESLNMKEGPSRSLPPRQTFGQETTEHPYMNRDTSENEEHKSSDNIEVVVEGVGIGQLLNKGDSNASVTNKGKASITSPSMRQEVLEHIEQEHGKEKHLFKNFKKALQDRWDKLCRFSIISEEESGARNMDLVRPESIILAEKYHLDVEKITSNHMLQSKNRDQEVLKMLKQLASFKPRLRSYEATELSKATSAALVLPLYTIQRDEEHRRGLPIVSSMIKCQIISSDDQKTSFTTATTYHIELKYGKMTWSIHRRTIDFVKLHYMLTFRYFQKHLPKPPHFPNQIVHFLELAWSTRMSMAAKDSKDFRRQQHANSRRQSLEDYLNQVLFTLHMHICTELLEFLEICGLDLGFQGIKRKEGYLKNRIMTFPTPQSWWKRILSFLWPFKKRFEEKWFVLRSSYIAFLDSIDQTVPSEVLLCDPSFSVKVLHFSGDIPEIFKREQSGIMEDDTKNKSSSWVRKKPRIQLSNSSKQVELSASSDAQLKYWIMDIERLVSETPFCQSQRYSSSFPVRSGASKNQTIDWLICAKAYFEKLCDVLEEATHEIYIQGWWVTPELYLKRPPALYPEWRLDKVLGRQAKRGVKIYILVYKEVNVALGIDSAYTKAILEGIHPNIKVQRHPDHYPGGVLYWTHHEKLVIIDQKIAFIGGLDLCFGRYDDEEHMLVDYPSVFDDYKGPDASECKDEVDDTTDIGCNINTTSDISEQDSLDDILDQEKHQKIHDTEEKKLREKISRFHELEQTSMEEFSSTASLYSIKTKKISKKKKDASQDPKSNGANSTSRESLSGTEQEVYHYTWPGLDYYNPRIRDIHSVRQFEISIVDRSVTPRMPWHDVQAMVKGNIARDLARHFIQMWNFVKREKSMHRPTEIPFLVPNEDYDQDTDVANDDNNSRCTMQTIRSCGGWSIGTVSPETSILTAHIKMIQEAKHFIYIENQFFITNNSSDSDQESAPHQNTIGKAILDRIIRAYNEKTLFRVIIVIPLLPAFEDEVYMSHATSVRMLVQATRTSIGYGPFSLLHRLKKACPDIIPENYISFLSLRTTSKLEERYLTEQIYVHSKIFIVDDLRAIIGSANLNDRSLVGIRDSEIGIIIEDDMRIPSILGGSNVSVGPKIQELRIKLLEQHLYAKHLSSDALADINMNFWPNDADTFVSEGQINSKIFIDLRDIVSDAIYHNVIRGSARYNTDLFRDTFYCVPDDNILTWEDYKIYLSKGSHPVLNITKSPRGRFVLYPTLFLDKEDLVTSIFNPSYLLPAEIYH